MVFAMPLILALTMIMQSTKRHLTKKLENLDWKLDEQKEISMLITNDVGDCFWFRFRYTRACN